MSKLNIYKILKKVNIIKDEEDKIIPKSETRTINMKNYQLRRIITSLDNLNLDEEVHGAYLRILNRFLEKENFEYLLYSYYHLKFTYLLSLEYVDNAIKMRVVFVDNDKCERIDMFLDDQSAIAKLYYDSCCKTKGRSKLTDSIKKIIYKF